MQTNNDNNWFYSKIARSIFYIVFIGGLFLLLSYFTEHTCNKLIFENFKMPCINTLEAGGIVAIGYIIFYGIKFGLDTVRLDRPNSQ